MVSSNLGQNEFGFVPERSPDPKRLLLAEALGSEPTLVFTGAAATARDLARLTISAKPVGVGAALQPWIVAGERPFSVRCYSLISLSVPSIAARLAAARFAASR